jgi:hypothetical protein
MASLSGLLCSVLKAVNIVIEQILQVRRDWRGKQRGQKGESPEDCPFIFT